MLSASHNNIAANHASPTCAAVNSSFAPVPGKVATSFPWLSQDSRHIGHATNLLRVRAPTHVRGRGITDIVPIIVPRREMYTMRADELSAAVEGHTW